MMNDFTISADGTMVNVWINKGGVLFGCKVDARDLELVARVPNTWHAMWDGGSQTHYAVTSWRDGSARKTVLMHRLIMQPDVVLEIDHRNHEGLDNRRENLRIATRKENALNRVGANRNNRCGARGVYFHIKTGKYRASVNVGGKRKEIGGFDSIVEAVVARDSFYRHENDKDAA